jgi:pimeloyl-ACP methyl ester carboxylesterase
VSAADDADRLLVTTPECRTLAVSVLGPSDGYPVVWCHGGLSSRLDARLAGDAPAETGVRLVTIDRPGIGASSRHRGRRVCDWPADVAAVVEALAIDRFAIAGWSAGGPFALACAALLPERVTAVATIGGMAPLESAADRRELGLPVDRVLLPLARRAPWLAALVLVPSRRMDAAAWKRGTLRSVPEPDRVALDPLPPDVAAGGSAAALGHGTKGTVDDYRAVGGAWGFDLGVVAAPVRCWQGDADTLVPRAHAHRLADALPTGTLHVVPDAGHFLVVRHGREVFARLLEDARG